MSFFDGMKDWVINIKEQIDKLDADLDYQDDTYIEESQKDD